MYTDQVLTRMNSSMHVGIMDSPDAIGQAGIPGQGNFLVLHLRLEDDHITDVRFQTYGCPAAIASGSWVAEWVIGKTRDEAAALTATQVREGLGGLPSGKEHGADLAVRALMMAIGS